MIQCVICNAPLGILKPRFALCMECWETLGRPRTKEELLEKFDPPHPLLLEAIRLGKI